MFAVRLLELLAGFLLLIAMYWSPTMIAFGRRTRDWVPIAIINTLAGWTIVGWLIAFAWSLMARATAVDAGEAVSTPKPRESWAALAARWSSAVAARWSSARLVRG